MIDTLRLGEPDASDLADRWRAADTRGLPGLAAHEGAAIWLTGRLRAVHALGALPVPVRDHLRQQALAASALRLEVEVEAAAVALVLERATVPTVFLKGVARCALASRYPYLDARVTSDVDVLVPEAQLAAAEAALRGDGYVPAVPPKPAGTPRHHHRPALHKGPIKVELHESTSVRVRPEVAWQRATTGSELVAWSGHRVRVPSATELAWSAVAHAMEDDIEGFRLKRYLELAALVSGGAPIDWSIIAERTATQECFDPRTGVRDEPAVVRRWIAAALALVWAGARPAMFDVRASDLVGLLDWRLAVLRSARRTGSQFADRLLAEGARVITGFPREGSPPEASRWGRIRRGVAGRLSRATFHAWRAARRG